MRIKKQGRFRSCHTLKARTGFQSWLLVSFYITCGASFTGITSVCMYGNSAIRSSSVSIVSVSQTHQAFPCSQLNIARVLRTGTFVASKSFIHFSRRAINSFSVIPGALGFQLCTHIANMFYSPPPSDFRLLSSTITF
jgi:hypothetical protein